MTGKFEGEYEIEPPKKKVSNLIKGAPDVVLDGKDTRPDSDYDPDQLAAGIKVEMEHTDNRDVAKAIAKTHLDESKDYYIKLKKYVE